MAEETTKEDKFFEENVQADGKLGPEDMAKLLLGNIDGETDPAPLPKEPAEPAADLNPVAANPPAEPASHCWLVLLWLVMN